MTAGPGTPALDIAHPHSSCTPSSTLCTSATLRRSRDGSRPSSARPVEAAGVTGHERAVADHEVRLAVEPELGEQVAHRCGRRRSRSPAAGCAAGPSPVAVGGRPRDAAEDRRSRPGRIFSMADRPRVACSITLRSVRRAMMAKAIAFHSRLRPNRPSVIARADDEHRRVGEERAARRPRDQTRRISTSVVFFLPLRRPSRKMTTHDQQAADAGGGEERASCRRPAPDAVLQRRKRCSRSSRVIVVCGGCGAAWPSLRFLVEAVPVDAADRQARMQPTPSTSTMRYGSHDSEPLSRPRPTRSG